ncbi:MAG: right-handed parallel beta-helix repeat-containing protein, partial [Rhodobacteraceae bacterium]|nr:right-handed parallel beta-helix repeat-containing protein [Paracoccaceae bacterium]
MRGRRGEGTKCVDPTNSVDIRNNIFIVQDGDAIDVADQARDGLVVAYNLYDLGIGSNIVNWVGTPFNTISDLRFELGLAEGGQLGTPVFVNALGDDGVAFTGDDDYHLDPASPGIDAGDPRSAYYLEPDLGGLRINPGAYGNTSEATVLPGDTLQVLTQNGLEKLTQGDETTSTFRSAGLTPEDPVLFINAGGPELTGPETWSNWRDLTERTAQLNTNFNAQDLDFSDVPEGVPADLFRSYAFSQTNGVGSTFGYDLDLADGAYVLRLYLAEVITSVDLGERVFDVFGNDVLLAEDVDALSLAGTYDKVVAVDIAVNVAGGAGLALDFVNKAPSQRGFIFGIEVVRPTDRTETGTITVDLSVDDGANYTPLATGLALDRFGLASLDWTPGVATTDNTAILRVTEEGAATTDTSDTGFLIAPIGNTYYVDDGSNANDQYTPGAVGDNANSGKTPDAPMASITALLRAYDLGPGDTVLIDTGDYSLIQNITLTEADEGDEGARLVFSGPTEDGKEATLTRSSSVNGAYLFDFSGADYVTLTDMTLRAGQSTILVRSDVGTEGLTFANLDIAGARENGIFVGRGSVDTLIENSVIFDTVGAASLQRGIYTFNTTDTVIRGNELFGHTDGIYSNADIRVLIENNVARDNADFGFELNTSNTANPAIIRNNIAFDNDDAGFNVFSSSSAVINWPLLENNIAFGHVLNNASGFDLSRVVSRGNEAYGNFRGFEMNIGESYGDVAFDNVDAGIYVDTGSGLTLIDGARIWTNGIGVEAAIFSNQSLRLTNSLIYGNTETGVTVSDSNIVELINNTIYQPVGDALIGTSTPNSLSLFNNIFWSDLGNLVNLSNAAQNVLDADRNLYFDVGGGIIAEVGGVQYATLAAYQALTGQDVNSLLGDPDVRDVDGADNIFG